MSAGRSWDPVEKASTTAALRVANVRAQVLEGQLAYARAICRILAGICSVQAVAIVVLGGLLVWRW